MVWRGKGLHLKSEPSGIFFSCSTPHPPPPSPWALWHCDPKHVLLRKHWFSVRADTQHLLRKQWLTTAPAWAIERRKSDLKINSHSSKKSLPPPPPPAICIMTSIPSPLSSYNANNESIVYVKHFLHECPDKVSVLRPSHATGCCFARFTFCCYDGEKPL